MIRVLHLTDFHLNKKTLSDWDSFLKDSLFEELSIIQETKGIDLVVFSGDMIDKGGYDFKEASAGFKLFQDKVIEPICSHLGLGIDRFIICPGNHDIERAKDKVYTEMGLRETLKDANEIAKFVTTAIDEEEYDGMKRIVAYKQFEKSFYSGLNEKNVVISPFECSFKINISGTNIGISSLNSAWRCYDDTDSGRIIVSDTQIAKNLKFIKECDLKIAVIHHPLDWLSEVEKNIVTQHLAKSFDMIFLGHVHNSASTMQTGFNGSLFINISPSGLNDIRSDSKTFSNGFVIVDKLTDKIDCSYYKYNHTQKGFVLNTDITKNGTHSFNIPKIEEVLDETAVDMCLKNIEEDHFAAMYEHFIDGQKDVPNAGDRIKDVFVMPPIDQGKPDIKEEKTQYVSLQEIVKLPSDVMFFGVQDSGKTSLLYRLVYEFVTDFQVLQRIPVYIDLKELGNKDIITAIKEYTRCNTDTVKTFLKSEKIVLLIDNLNYKNYDLHQIKIAKIHSFKRDNPKIRIIAGASSDIIGIIPPSQAGNCKIPFAYYFIKGLRTKEIKEIMRKWVPNDDEVKSEEKLDKLVRTFTSYSLPNNPMSVNLYLWSSENSDRKPINQAVLMEIYIEIILEKLKKENIYRNTFDFTNKMQLIAKIAEEMLIKDGDDYGLTLSDFLKVVEKYIKDVGFQFDVQTIIDYLFERKIFVKAGEIVRFPHNCFFDFFTAKRMEYDKEFKDYILSEEQYFKYTKQIDYYTGLARSDKDTFKLILERFEIAFQPADFLLERIDIDDYFTIKYEDHGKEVEDEPKARNLELAKIKNSRPQEHELEEQYDRVLEDISQPKISKSTRIKANPDTLLFLMCNVLRNSEGIEDFELKCRAYDSIIKYNMAFSIMYSQWIIRYVLKHQSLPPSFPPNVTLEDIIVNLPFFAQNTIYQHIGTAKLSNVILEKIKKDKKGQSFTKSEVEAYYSVALYADVYGAEFEKVLRVYLKSIDTSAAQNYLYYKLLLFFYKRTRPGSDNEAMYLDLLADLQIKTQKLTKRVKQSIIKKFKEQKNKWLN